MKSFLCSMLVQLMVLPLIGREFQNLGFEHVDSSSVQFGLGPTEQLLPGWTLQEGVGVVHQMAFGDKLPGNYIGPHLYKAGGATPKYNGEYILALQEQLRNSTLDRFELSQVGLVPVEAYYLRYAYVNLPFSVSINGSQISPLNITGLPEQPSSEIPLTLVTLDLSKYRGQEVLLTFKTEPGNTAVFGSHFLYDVAFTIPEPSTFLLSTLGLLAGGLRWFLWRNRGSNLERYFP